MRLYLLGVATPLAVALLVWVGGVLVLIIKDDWHGGECGICRARFADAPLWKARLRWHSRRRHGLYFLLSTRIRKRQLGGLAMHYAMTKTGCSEQEWHEAVAAVPGRVSR